MFGSQQMMRMRMMEDKLDQGHDRDPESRVCNISYPLTISCDLVRSWWHWYWAPGSPQHHTTLASGAVLVQICDKCDHYISSSSCVYSCITSLRHWRFWIYFCVDKVILEMERPLISISTYAKARKFRRLLIQRKPVFDVRVIMLCLAFRLISSELHRWQSNNECLYMYIVQPKIKEESKLFPTWKVCKFLRHPPLFLIEMSHNFCSFFLYSIKV